MIRNRIMDGNKILYHPDWVEKWRNDPFSCAPIYVEVTPAGACNHRCTFCAVDYIGYRTVYLDRDVLADRFNEMGSAGVKSVMFAGEGEPTLHKHFAEMCNDAKSAGLDVAITTNGTGLTRSWAERALHTVTWMKVSLDAATAKTHSEIHQCPEGHFLRVVRNIKEVVAVRATLPPEVRAGIDIGAQMILMPQNWREAGDLVRILRDCGADYLAVKPYSQHPSSVNQGEELLGNDFHYTPDFMKRVEDQLFEAADGQIDIEFRKNTMSAYENPDRGYSVCQATPTAWGYVMADGDVYSCSAYLLDPRFNMGNIMRKTFNEVWYSETRREHLAWVLNQLDISECRKNCRMNSVNQTLTRAIDVPQEFQDSLDRTRGLVTPDNLNFI